MTAAHFEFLLLILVRITGFVFTAPFFNLKNVPRRVKTGFSCAMTLLMFFVLPLPDFQFQTAVDFGLYVAGEAVAGLTMGFISNLCYQVLAFAGQMIDMEIGFSMVNEYDPVTSAQVTITGDLYSHAVMLILMLTYMHHFLIQALADSFSMIPVGYVSMSPMIYTVVTDFIADYLILGFRIVLPMFACILMVNCILAILAKVAPQMNMFVIGLQLKVFVGLAVLFIMMEMLPAVSDTIFENMIVMLKKAVSFLGS